MQRLELGSHESGDPTGGQQPSRSQTGDWSLQSLQPAWPVGILTWDCGP